MASLTRIIDPPELEPAFKAKLTQYALQAFQLLSGAGAARIDFIFDKATGQLYFNEINPIPGSLAFYLWERTEPPLLYPELIDSMISQAKARHRQAMSLNKALAFKAL